MEVYALRDSASWFASSQDQFERVVGWLDGGEAAGLEHSELEARLQDEGRELLRRLLQDHLTLRAEREVRRAEVTGSDGVARRRVETRTRRLRTVFGEVAVTRLAYRRPMHENLHPLDAELNLPLEKHSHGLRELAAIESARGSFEGAVEAIERVTGSTLGKRQVEVLAQRCAVDFEAFYEQRPRFAAKAEDLLVLSCDGKGIVMCRDALRDKTRRKAEQSSPKLQTRVSKGEKRNRKRMAEVGAVYDCSPVVRTPLDILGRGGDDAQRNTDRPKARSKWLTASVVESTRDVIARVFDEAQRRDPKQKRQWVVLVDGLKYQLECIEAEAQERGLDVVIVVDFIHVLEHLWEAAWCFFDNGDPAAERWVHEHAFTVLQGRPSDVAGAVRRKATYRRLSKNRRRNADECATYLLRKKKYLDYPTALDNGWPIATGVIEGACRHLIMDRMALTGARWKLVGAEAVLKLRALRANGDFEDYWRFHLRQEHQRVHRNHCREATPAHPP